MNIETLKPEPVTEKKADKPLTDAALLALLTEAADEYRPKIRMSLEPKLVIKALSFVGGVIAGRTTLPVLNMIQCSGYDDRLAFTATDLDLTITATFNGADRPGVCLLPKLALLSAIKGSKGMVTIDEQKGYTFKITADGCSRTIPGMNPDEAVPEQRIKKVELSAKLSAAKFREALKIVEAAISTDASRYVLNGVYLNFTPNEVTIVTTDGRRLHLTSMMRLDPDKAWADKIAAKNKCEHSFGVIVPTNTVKHLLKMPMEKTDDLLVVEASHCVFAKNGDTITCDQVSFSYGRFLLMSKKVDGNYPNYNQVIPKDCKETVTVLANELATAINNVKSVLTKKSNMVKLTLSRHKLTVTASSPELGEDKAEIVTNYHGKDGCVIAFNHEYLLDVCASFKDGELEFEYTDELSPGKFVCGPAFAVVMPMRLS